MSFLEVLLNPRTISTIAKRREAARQLPNGHRAEGLTSSDIRAGVLSPWGKKGYDLALVPAIGAEVVVVQCKHQAVGDLLGHGHKAVTLADRPPAARHQAARFRPYCLRYSLDVATSRRPPLITPHSRPARSWTLPLARFWNSRWICSRRSSETLGLNWRSLALVPSGTLNMMISTGTIKD